MSMYSLCYPLVRVNRGIGPRPRKKKLLTKQSSSSSGSSSTSKETQVINPSQEEAFLTQHEDPLVGEKVGDEVEEKSSMPGLDNDNTCTSVLVLEKNDESANLTSTGGGGLGIAENGLEKELEPIEEECDPEIEEDLENHGPDEQDPQEKCLLLDGNIALPDATAQAGENYDFKLEGNDVAEERNGDCNMSSQHDADEIVEEIEYVVEEIEEDDGNDLPVNGMDEQILGAGSEEYSEIVNEMHNQKNLVVFLRGLDKSTTEDDIKKVYDSVIDIKLVNNKGYAFLHFANVQQANHAVTELKNSIVNGKRCTASPAFENDTLFLGNICETWTKATLEERLEHFAIMFEDLTLVEDTKNSGFNRGFAFLKFSSHADAMDAYKRLQKRDVVLGLDRSAKVSFAYPAIGKSNNLMQVARVFLDDLPASWDRHQIKEHLKKLGNIENIEVVHYGASAKKKDFGFVTFSSRNEAVACVEFLNRTEFKEGNNKVKIKAMLPDSEESKWKHQVRGNFHVGKKPAYKHYGASKDFRHRGIDKRQRRESPVMNSFDDYRFSADFRDRQPHRAVPGRTNRVYEKKYPDTPKAFYSSRGIIPHRDRDSAEYDPRLVLYRRSEHHFMRSRNSVGVPRDGFPSQRKSICMDEACGTHHRSRSPSMVYGESIHMSSIASHHQPRTAHVNDFHGKRVARGFPSYFDGHAHGYVSFSGSKRQYSAMDDTPPIGNKLMKRTERTMHRKWTSSQVHERTRYLDREIVRIDDCYEDTYDDRTRRYHPGYVNGTRGVPSQAHSAVHCNCREYDRCSSIDYEDGMYSRGWEVDYEYHVDESLYGSPCSSHYVGGDDYLDGGFIPH
ncbi:hypothetical protein Tsubulata_019132 [Turnera subulata]|uniref:RRM domain-containing protein n=1 Tax=Turnera subulata TaxID=218843 RepID=A0A9Q0GIN5_9ROSI|nr:hypothetical protein Tsubulata_019132 [Turnera subulata]